MPDNREEWVEMMIETGQIPDSNGYYHYNPVKLTEGELELAQLVLS